MVVGEKTAARITLPTKWNCDRLSPAMSLVVVNLECWRRVRMESWNSNGLARRYRRNCCLFPSENQGCACRKDLPCLEVAGDYYDVFPPQGTGCWVAWETFPVKGMGPALIMAIFRRPCHRPEAGLPEHALGRSTGWSAPAPRDMSSPLRRVLFQESSELIY